MRHSIYTKVVLIAAVAGLVFSSFSTFDFAKHLDREMHGVHCSFIPGLSALDATGSSGCQVAMMSPYSSVLRQSMWGGLPISLPAMSVFAFLLFFAAHLSLSRSPDRASLRFLALATILPLGASIGMAVVSFTTLGTFCKLCIGIYASSAVAFLAAVLAWRVGPSTNEATEPQPNLYAMFALGIVFVALPAAAWIGSAPDVDAMIGECGQLDDDRDHYGVMVALDPARQAPQAIEILDPLCPACRAFEDRLTTAGLDTRLDRKVILFPLDNACNWMVDKPIHPGACTVSEAVLCAGENASDVIDWAFDHQAAIREAAAADPRAAQRMVTARFPALASCVGSASARSKLNKSLRWAVRNRLPVMTPQLYLEGIKLCDGDLDLGLDYALSTLLDRHAAGTLPKITPPSLDSRSRFTEVAAPQPDAAENTPTVKDVPPAAVDLAEPEAAAEAVEQETTADVPKPERATEPTEPEGEAAIGNVPEPVDPPADPADSPADSPEEAPAEPSETATEREEPTL
ncbi:MAG: vitamin K epoxide reductase family protein [Polyangiales bacterium]